MAPVRRPNGLPEIEGTERRIDVIIRGRSGRRNDYHTFEVAVVNPNVIPYAEEDEGKEGIGPRCPICAEIYNHSTRLPVRPRCLHLVCRSCLERRCRDNLPTGHLCPICREQLFQREPRQRNSSPRTRGDLDAMGLQDFGPGPLGFRNNGPRNPVNGCREHRVAAGPFFQAAYEAGEADAAGSRMLRP